MPRTSRILVRRLVAALLLVIPLLVLFRRALFYGEVFAFRDVGYYYYPYYEYVQQQWQFGIPLWNPLDGIGQPLLADPTAAVFYPGKLVFLLPTSYQLCFAVYLLLHAWLAGLGAYVLARQIGAGWSAAVVAGLSYELSGQVVFQYCNPIYLVGASWLPWSLMFFLRLRDRRRLSLPSLSITLCMVVMGGDPQMAVHVVLCAFLWILMESVEVWRSHGQNFTKSSCYGLSCKLAISIMLAILLSAIQVLPSKEWSGQSDRSLSSVPRSVWEMAFQGSWNSEGLWKRGVPATDHEEKIDDFSVGPWRCFELFWPNISGQLAPVSTRWLRALPGEGRMWTPSLYLGILPIGLALSRIRFRTGCLRIRWLSWLTLLALLAAFGEYGFGWLADEYQHFASASGSFEPSQWKRGVGGVYWLLTTIVPSYVEFRYPAKWWTIASLGFSLLAAKGWPLLFCRFQPTVMKKFAIASLVALAVAVVCRFLVTKSIPASAVFGPFQDGTGWVHLTNSIVHTVIVGGLVMWLSSSKSQHASGGLLGICLCELVMAQSGLIHTVPPAERYPMTRTTVYRGQQSYPPEFKVQSSLDRMVELRDFELRTKFGKHHLTTRTRSLDPICSMKHVDYANILLQQAELPSANFWDLFGVGKPLDGKARAWLVYHWNQSDDVAEVGKRQDGMRFAQREFATVETSDAIPKPPPLSTHRGDRCIVVLHSSSRVEVQVRANSPCLLVLCDQFFDGWTATSISKEQSRPLKIYRTNKVMRGVFIDATDTKIGFRISPEIVLCRRFY